MVSNRHLDRVIAKETSREVLSCLTGAELIVLHLRMEGHNYDEIAELCGISRTAACMRLATAKRRISRIIPELGDLIEDRRQPRIYKDRTDKTSYRTDVRAQQCCAPTCTPDEEDDTP